MGPVPTEMDTIKVNKYYIAQGSRLESQLKKFQVMGDYHRNSGALPDPTLAKLSEKLYLVLTEVGSGAEGSPLPPSLCFYELKKDKNQPEIFEQNNEISAQPTFEIKGAEMYLRTDNKNNVFFLTNKGLVS